MDIFIRRSKEQQQRYSPAADSGTRQTPARPRAKVKTGCRTCKLRKVKCDEGRPACTRCLSTGRVCEGYGVWGGGSAGAQPDSTSAIASAAVMMGMARRQRQSIQPPPWLSVPRQVLNGTLAPLSPQEYGWLDWFRWRTAVKLRGAFSMAFWDVLVIRASLEEPAILHAALALSTVHRRVGGGEGMGIGMSDRGDVLETCSEELTLQQYNKAIRHLIVSPSTRDTATASEPTTDVASTRIMLVACMLFTCLEFMRGRFQTGSTHLQNGIRLLGGLFAESHRGRSSSTTALDSFSLIRDRHYPRSNMDPIDQWLLEAFARMNLLAAQFGHGYAGSLLPTAPQYFLSPDHHLLALPITFASVNQARNILDQLVYDVLSLTGQCRQHQYRRHTPSLFLPDDESAYSPISSASSSPGMQTTALLAREQSRLDADLNAWYATYRASRISLYARPDVDLLVRVAYQMLVLYYGMASILVATCLAPDTELAFDAHVEQFLAILHNALLFIRAVKDVHNSRDANFRIDPELSKQLGSAAAPTVCLFNADVGWTPPLYFTALHCRVSRIRRQAVRFIKSIPSREGLWDSQLASAVAEEVIRLEEMIEATEVAKEPGSPPYLDDELFQKDSQSTALITLPASHPRIHSVHIVLPDSWSGTTTMTCKKRWSDGSCEAIQRVYDPAPRRWTSISS